MERLDIYKTNDGKSLVLLNNEDSIFRLFENIFPVRPIL